MRHGNLAVVAVPASPDLCVNIDSILVDRFELSPANRSSFVMVKQVSLSAGQLDTGRESYVMMRRGRRRGIGLARTMARTAVVAGTARAVSGRVSARQQAASAKTADAHGSKAAPGRLTDEVVDQLKKLAELRDAGVLSDKEFAAKKAKLLH